MDEKLPQAALDVMNERFGKDSLIALATLDGTRPSVRTVDAFYEDGAFYVIAHALSGKMKQIAADLHCARNKAIKLVTQLEDAGLITRVKAEHYHPNRYYIHNITEDKNE